MGHTVVIETGEVVVEPGPRGLKGIIAPSCVELDSAVVVPLARVVDRVGAEGMA